MVVVGQSGMWKSHLIQAIGQQACVLGYRVRYTTSAFVLADLTASLADQTLPRRLRDYANFDLVILDEFGFDRIERTESPQAASLNLPRQQACCTSGSTPAPHARRHW